MKWFIHKLLHVFFFGFVFKSFSLITIFSFVLWVRFFFSLYFVVAVFRFNVSKSEAKAEPIYCIAIGHITLSVVASVCKMVDCPDISTHLCVFTVSLCDASAELDHLHVQCE